jgi:hypothetical protein
MKEKTGSQLWSLRVGSMTLLSRATSAFNASENRSQCAWPFSQQENNIILSKFSFYSGFTV